MPAWWDRWRDRFTKRLETRMRQRFACPPTFRARPVKAFRAQVSLSGKPLGVLPVNLAIALAKAGASGGSPGSPMPVGGSRRASR